MPDSPIENGKCTACNIPCKAGLVHLNCPGKPFAMGWKTIFCCSLPFPKPNSDDDGKPKKITFIEHST